MNAICMQLLSLSWSASVLALAVMTVRLLFRKMPKRIACLLWLLVALRLVIPFSVQSSASLQIVSDPFTPVLLTNADSSKSEGTIQDRMILQQASEPRAPIDAPLQHSNTQAKDILGWIWLAGLLTMLGYMAGSYHHLYRRVEECILSEQGVYRGNAVDSPFVMGLFRPRIYLPDKLSDEDMTAVLAHERCHIRRKDHWIKPAAFVILAVYWFNPVLWAAYLLLCRDIEGACDEKVLADMDTAARANYSRALINCAVRRNAVAACPVAFGEVGVKGRVKNVLSYKKPTLWVILLAVATCIMLTVCFMTDPQDPALDNAVHEVVLSENRSPYCVGQPVEDHRIFQVNRSGDQVTVYAMVLYEELLPDGTEDCGSHCAVKLTFAGHRGGEYELQEYWTPRDGTLYAPSIRENFPIWLWGSAMNTQRYIARQESACKTQFYQLDLDQWLADGDKCYALRTPYVGNNAAVGAILDALGAGEYGPYTFSLQSDKFPYGIALHYRSEVLDRGHIYGWANRMQQVAWQTLALVENAQWVSWDISYPDGDVFPGGIAKADDTVLTVKNAYYSLNAFINLRSALDQTFCELPDGAIAVREELYRADVSDPGWENTAVLTKTITMGDTLVDNARSITATLHWQDGSETLHNMICISTFDDLPVYEIGGVSPDGTHRPEGMALLTGDGVDSGLRIWQIGTYYYMGRVDEQGNTLYVYRCELRE